MAERGPGPAGGPTSSPSGLSPSGLRPLLGALGSLVLLSQRLWVSLDPLFLPHSSLSVPTLHSPLRSLGHQERSQREAVLSSGVTFC